MRRRDWVEVEDLRSCPKWIRDAMTGYLQVVITKARPYDVAAPIIQDLVVTQRATQLLDLASGGGGPWPGLLEDLTPETGSIGLTLTDIEPSDLAADRVASVDGVRYEPTAVSALDVPPGEAQVWTMFTGLHHFSPRDVAEMVRQVQDRRVAFAAFEATQRSTKGLLVTVMIPALVLLLMPLVRPARLWPLVFTYLVPLLPLLIWWDGMVSTLKTYTVPELEEIVGTVASPDYDWSVSELAVAGAPIPVLALVGRPRGGVA